ncbi:MAG TPA: TRIC cation channel family protein [Nevskiaceae bacterium]|nr:TRIC cation channel family protein [Nevskiaceae bacterium]
MVIHLLDLVGVFAFAAYGARQGIRAGFDSFGVFACAFLTSLGGGSIRELILHNQPTYFHNYAYLYAVIGGATFAMLLNGAFGRLHRPMLVLDAIGLSTFALLGAQRASAYGFGLAAMGMFALLTAVGGGILTDLVCGRKPAVFMGGFYAAPALALAVMFFLIGHAAQTQLAALLLISTTILLRLGGYWWTKKRTHGLGWQQPWQTASEQISS